MITPTEKVEIDLTTLIDKAASVDCVDLREYLTYEVRNNYFYIDRVFKPADPGSVEITSYHAINSAAEWGVSLVYMGKVLADSTIFTLTSVSPAIPRADKERGTTELGEIVSEHEFKGELRYAKRKRRYWRACRTRK